MQQLRIFTLGAVAFLVTGIAAGVVYGRAGQMTLAVALPVAFSGAAVAFFLIGRTSSRMMRQSLAAAAKVLADAGPPPIVDPIAGTATIVSFRETGERLSLGVARHFVLDFVLDVQPAGGAPYRVDGLRASWPELRLGSLRPKERIAVKIDRADPKRLEFDFETPPA